MAESHLCSALAGCLPPSATSRLESITPEKAAEYLARPRPHVWHPNQKRVDRMTAMIQRGEWVPSSDSIVFDVNGALMDGLHRLMAIAAAGVACEAIIIEGVEPFVPRDLA